MKEMYEYINSQRERDIYKYSKYILYAARLKEKEDIQ